MELNRDNEIKPWVAITVEDREKLTIEFDKDFVQPGEPICIASKQDADQLSEVLRNMVIDYMD